MSALADGNEKFSPFEEINLNVKATFLFLFVFRKLFIKFMQTKDLPRQTTNMEEVQELNIVGVNYLQAKEFHQAAKVFANAIQQMSAIEPHESNNTDDNVELSSTLTEYNFLPLNQPSCPNGLFVYSQAVLFQSVGNNDSERRLASAAITFNLALTLHIKGLECSKSSLLVKSTQIYHTAKAILLPVSIVGSHTNEMPLVLAMAIENNIGHICFELGDLDKMKKSFSNVNAIIQSRPNWESEKDDNFFSVNALVLGYNCGGASVA